MQGRVEYQGNFTNLKKTDEIFQYLNLNDPREEEESIKKKESIRNSNGILHSQSTIILDENEKKDPEETEKLLGAKNVDEKSNEKKILKRTEDAIPKPKFVYWKYFTTSSHVMPFAVLLAFVIAQLLCSSCDYFVAYW